MRRIALIGVWISAACGDPTVYPQEPMAVFGPPDRPWVQCTSQNLPSNVAGAQTLFVENTLDRDLILTYVDANCVESEIGVLLAGKTASVDSAPFGSVFGVRDPETYYLFTAIHWFGEPETLVIP